MVEMRNIIALDDDLVSAECRDENKREFYLKFRPSTWEILECDVEKDSYVAHAMQGICQQIKAGTLHKYKNYLVAIWY